MALLDGADAPAAPVVDTPAPDRPPTPRPALRKAPDPLRPVGGPRDRFPVTSAQRRLWVLDHIIPNPEVYNVWCLVRITGPIDPDTLRQAFELVDARHESMRTHFETEDGLPVQVIGAPRPFQLRVVDLTHLSADEAKAVATQEAAADAARRIPLDGDRLWRAALYRAADDDHYLWLNMQHGVMDGASIGVIFRDLERGYEAIREGAEPLLPDLPVQYGDYAVWEQAWCNSPAHRERVEFWKKALAGPLPALDLPFARPRPRWQTFKGDQVRFDVPPAVVAALDRLCQGKQATRFTAGLAALQVVLNRYTGQEDLTLGAPMKNRVHAETRDLVGMFANLVVLRTSLAGDPTFRELLGRVKKTRDDAFANENVSLESLVEELRPARDTSRQPFFQAAFYYQNVPMAPATFAGHEATLIHVPNGTAMFDFRLVLEDGPAGSLWGWAEFNTDLFDRAQVERMVGHWLTVLEAAAADPDTPVRRLPLLTPAERQQLLFDWNQTAGAYPADDCLPDAFTRRAAESPTAPALVAGGKTVTYRQLNDRANRLAHALLARGVKSDDLVGVCLKRSADMVAAVLAVTKVGAAYVPLDSNYPKDRLGFMLEDTNAALVLTQTALLDRLPASDRLVNLDELDADLARLPATEPPRTHTPDAVAYVIFTSGSTGKPKGVVVRHRAAINTIDWVSRTFAVGPGDRLLFVTSLSFDLSVYDVFGVLGAGGCLRVADEAELRDPARLADVLRGEGITMWDSAPAALQQLVPFLTGKAGGPDLRLVMLSGDWIPVTLPDQVRAAFPNAKVMSLGGATEAAIWSNWFPIGTVDPAWPSIPYGKPIRNCWYHILDRDLRPLPVGVPGELYVGGLCLADGYLNRPELTAERFIPDPVRPGERLYKSGDLARYMPDGNIEFLGRIDHQVKVRGFRVELGEIEAALAQHPAVRGAVVKPFRDDTGSVSLAAYVVRKAPVESADLAKHLRAGLPEYMVPSAVVFLDAIPMTPNGKVDRAALPVPDAPAAARAAGYEQPATDAERALQALWEEVLNVRPVSVTARFEELGGHSLMAAQLVSRIDARLGHKVPLETLFKAPTVRELAALIERKLELGGGGSLVPLTEEGSQPPLFLIAGAGGHVFAFHKFARLLGADFPAYGMKAIGVDGSEPPPDRVEAIAARYLEEIVKARPKGPYVLGGFSVGGLMAFELALQMQKRGLDVSRVIVFDTHAPGYPRRLPLPVRLGIHLLNFLSRPGERKWAYLRDRLANLRHRFLTLLRLNHLDLAPTAGVGAHSDEVLRRVWAALERATQRYWPQGVFDGQVVVVRSEVAEHWAATRLDDPLLGWARWTTRPVQTIGSPARHMEIFSDQTIEALAKQVREVIRTGSRRSRPGSRETLVLP